MAAVNWRLPFSCPAAMAGLIKALSLLVVVGFTTIASAASLTDNFDDASPSVITETGEREDSIDPHWWLNSGAYVQRAKGYLQTVQGKLDSTDHFRWLYAVSNPTDTDNGYYPQNLLRLVTQAKFTNFSQQVFFNIAQIQVSASPNRNQSNGVFFFHRYQDGNNLYYVGIRVDGCAVVKKKIAGRYAMLKSVVVYPGQYHPETLPNLLPLHRWIGIKTEVASNARNGVDITLYLNDPQLGPGWTKILQVEDNGADGERIMNEGYAGIRSDFMDVSFDAYSAIETGNKN
jgi:hypothetical protein